MSQRRWGLRDRHCVSICSGTEPSSVGRLGSAFQGSVHVMPVKNEEGLVMLFILNFDYVLDEGSDDSTEKTAHASPTRSDQRRRRFLRFRQAALSLMGTAKQPLPQEDPDAVLVDPPGAPEDPAPGGPPSPARGPCGAAEPEASDTSALIAPSRRGSRASEGPGPPDPPTPQPPWEEPPPSGAQAQPLPRDGPASMRRASSLHDMERFSCSAKGLFRERHGSEGPFNHLKSSLLGSNSESNINRFSTNINKIPLIALNFSDGGDKKTHSPPASENTIIAPKVKDRTHNVTEKVTQVRPSSPGPPQVRYYAAKCILGYLTVPSPHKSPPMHPRWNLPPQAGLLSPETEPPQAGLLSPETEPLQPGLLSPETEPPQAGLLSPETEPPQAGLLSPETEPPQAGLLSPETEPPQAGLLSPETEPPQAGLLSPETEPPQAGLLSPETEPPQAGLLSPETEPPQAGLLSPETEPPQAGLLSPETEPPQAGLLSPETEPPQAGLLSPEPLFKHTADIT
ncbi:unnamed protein product [Boreogadus saida]